MKYWNLTFSNETSPGASAQSREHAHKKNRTQIEVIDQKMLRFRPGTEGEHTSVSRLLSLLLLAVGLALFAFASAGVRDELSDDGLIVFVRCIATMVCQTAQCNMIWAGISRCLINDISNSQFLVLYASWIYINDICHIGSTCQKYIKPMIKITIITCGCKTFISSILLQSDLNK